MAEADPKIEKPVPGKLTTAFAVRLDALLRVKAFISKEETRYYLNGVFVQACPDGGALCVATDGHRMGVRRDPAGIVQQPTIVRIPAELKLPRKGLFNAVPWVVCMSNGSKGHMSLVPPMNKVADDTAEAAIANVEDCIMRFGGVVIDGTFPDWQRVMPKEKKATRVGFNGRYFAGFGQSLEISGEGQHDPYLIQDESDRDFVGILMPMRTGAGDIPAWLHIKEPA